MPKTKLTLLLVFFLLPITLIVLLVAGNAQAASSASPTGITVSPAFQQVSIAPGASQQPVNFSITNDKPNTQTINLSVADFNTLDESGGLFFVGTNPTQIQQKYGLAKWVNLPDKQVIIQPHQTIKIEADILNLPTLAAGGHYGALMLSLGSNTNRKSSNSVGVHPIASSLLFITKPLGATYKLGLVGVSYSRSFLGLPKSVTLRFQNVGNTHVTPRGYVAIADPNGRLLSKGIVNENSGLILPSSFKKYSVSLKTISASKPTGKYKITINYRFDGYPNYRTYQARIWVVKTPILIAAFVVVILVVVCFGILIRQRLMKILKKADLHKIISQKR